MSVAAYWSIYCFTFLPWPCGLLATLTTLSSAANHLVTVYDVNHASSGHLEVYGVSSLLPGSSVLDLPILGSLVFQLTDDEDQTYYHVQLSSRGSLWKTNVSFSPKPAPENSGYHPGDFEWTDGMHELGMKGRTMTEDVGNLGGTEYIIADLRGIYESKRLRLSDQVVVAYFHLRDV